MTKLLCLSVAVGVIAASTALAQEVVTRGHYSLERTKQTNALVAKVDVDAAKTNLPAGYELQHSTEYKTGEKERIFYNKDSNRKIRVRTMLFPSVTEAENGVISQLKSVSVIFTSGSPSGGTIGDNSWFNTTEGTGSTAVTFIRRNVVISVFAQQDAAVADKLARDLDADILAGKNGIELKDHK
jgi:hypothetical protein